MVAMRSSKKPWSLLLGLTLGAALLSARAAEAQIIDVYQGNFYLGSITPYQGGAALSSVDNYAYNAGNDSGFPIHGPAPAAQEGQLYFYQGADGLSLFAFFNKEGGSSTGTVTWDVIVSGNATDASVRVSDDPDTGPSGTGELRNVSGPEPDVFDGAWSWGNHSDGGVIGELAGDAWTVTIDPVSYGGASGLTALRAYDSTGSYLTLNLATDATGFIEFRPRTSPVLALPIEVWQGSTYLGSITPYQGGAALSSVDNYAYNPGNDSGFPIHGPAPAAQEGQLYFYRGSDGLSLFAFFNKEGGSSAGTVTWDVIVSGNATDASVRVSDDPDTGPNGTGELENVPGQPDVFTGAWTWNTHSDGGVIGELAGDAWAITIDPVSYGGASGLTTLRAYDATGSYLTLNLATDASGTIQLKPGAPVPVPALPLFAGAVLAGALAALGGRGVRHVRR